MLHMMKELKQHVHEHCFMCSRVLNDWLPVLELERKVFRVKKGRSVFVEGDPVEGIYFVMGGLIKVHKDWGGKELILRFAVQDTVLGHRGLSVQDDPYPVSATALQDSVVCFVPKSVFLSSLMVNQQFCADLLMFLAEELRLSEQKMLDINLKSVKSRMSKAILVLARDFGTDADQQLNISLNKNDLAAYAGTTYETSFRIMNELIASGCLKVKGKLIQIVDAAALERFAVDL